MKNILDQAFATTTEEHFKSKLESQTFSSPFKQHNEMHQTLGRQFTKIPLKNSQLLR